MAKKRPAKRKAPETHTEPFPNLRLTPAQKQKLDELYEEYRLDHPYASMSIFIRDSLRLHEPLKPKP